MPTVEDVSNRQFRAETQAILEVYLETKHPDTKEEFGDLDTMQKSAAYAATFAAQATAAAYFTATAAAYNATAHATASTVTAAYATAAA